MKRATSALILVGMFSVSLNIGCDLQTDPNSSLNQSTGQPRRVVSQPLDPTKDTDPATKSTDPAAKDTDPATNSSSPPLTKGTDSPAEKSTDSPSLLVKKELQVFYDRMRSDDEAVRLEALDDLLPQKKHLIELFGNEDGSRLWDLISPKLDDMRLHADEVSKEVTKNGEVVDIVVYDVREKEAERYADVPAKFPVFHVATKYKNGNSSGSSSYIVFDEDVVMIRGVEGMAGYLKKNPKENEE